MLGKIEGKRRRGQQRMRWLDGITNSEFEQTLGDGERQESLVCCSPWGWKESDTTGLLTLSLSCIGEGNGKPLQWYCLENPRDGGAWWALSLRSHRVRHDWSDLAAAACLFNWWCHPTISSSAAPFSSCPQSFPVSGSFPMSWLSASGGPSTGALVSASVLPMNIQGWFPLGLTGLISWQSKGLSRDFFLAPQFESLNSLVLRL